jgi:SAM-dependent methyltransferase
VSFDDLVPFFAERRNRPEDLYPSEARFLPNLAAGAQSVLDVGSATGGFVDIWRAYNPTLRYTGVDVSPALVTAAREAHPDVDFVVGDAAAGLPLPEASADVVAALGWLHWEPRWQAALAELWRLAGRSLFFDVRLHDGTDDLVGAQAIPGGEVPYLCLAWPRFRDALLELGAGAIAGYGYTGAPSDTVKGMPETICFAAFVVERGTPPPTLSLDLPFTE